MSMTFWWNSCRRVEQQLSLSAAGLLPETDRRRVELHLSRCPRCQARLHALRIVTAGLETLGQALPLVDAPVSLRRRWEQAVWEGALRQPALRSARTDASDAWLPTWLGRIGLCRTSEVAPRRGTRPTTSCRPGPLTRWVGLVVPRLEWGAVVACWALAALLRFGAPEAPRPTVAGTPLSLREILVVLQRERPWPHPAVFPGNPAPSEPKPSRPSARGETPASLEVA